jgi:signal recognition particle subunit SRP54
MLSLLCCAVIIVKITVSLFLAEYAMFENLSDRLTKTLKNISGRGRLTEENIKETLREVRMALLEADVALPVIREFIGKVKERAVGQDVSKSLTPGQVFVKIVQSELESAMGDVNEGLDLKATPPAIVLMAGLQGAGKTTSVAKLAKFLTEREKKKVLVVSVDVYRPAAIKQLETLASEVDVEFFPSEITQKPIDIAEAAIDHAKKKFFDVVIVDTAGRLHVDAGMMGEIKDLHAAINPVETLFTVDAMTGQDAANTAKAFDEALPLTGIILTKTDGDARGGAALSIRHITGKPIKFMGVGEKTDALEAFHPDRIASRILGMGDVLSLIEEVEQKVDKKKAEKLANKVKSGKGFDLEDFRDQLVQMKSMGGMSGLMTKMPGMGNISDKIKDQVDDKLTNQMEAIINSMTAAERVNPDIIKGSRKRRIANGSGTQIQDVNKLLKQFSQMQKMMKKMSVKGGMKKMMRSMQGMMPPGGGGGGMGGMFGR